MSVFSKYNSYTRELGNRNNNVHFGDNKTGFIYCQRGMGTSFAWFNVPVVTYITI